MNCRCVQARIVAYNVERAWKGLMRAPRIESSPLLEYTRSNMWVRGRQLTFQKHLKHVAIRHIAKYGPWFFKVATDADLITAWLATTILRGGEIYDPDAQNPSMEHLTLVDLILPPDLLIIHLGIKRASNKEMAGVLHEALSTRYHEDKPTWLFDQPYAPLAPGHLCYDMSLEDSLAMWGYKGPVQIGAEEEDVPKYGFFELHGGDEGETEEPTPVRKSTSRGTAEESGGGDLSEAFFGGGTAPRYNNESEGKSKGKSKGKGGKGQR